MSAFLIAMLIAVYTLQSLLTRKYSEYYPGEERLSSPVFTIFAGVVVAAVSYAISGFYFEASMLTVLLGAMNGAALFGYNTCIIGASKKGPYSIVMVFMIAGGIILPLISAMIGFGEDISLRKWIAILVLIGAVYMTSKKDEDTEFADRKGFWIYCVGLAAFNGIYGALLAIQQRLTSTAEREEMVAVTFCVAMLISGLVLVAHLHTYSELICIYKMPIYETQLQLL